MTINVEYFQSWLQLFLVLLELVAHWLGGLKGGFLLPVLKTLFSPLVKGTTAIVANHGVAETLTINLTGINAFVIAYAVANLQRHISLRVLPIFSERPKLNNRRLGQKVNILNDDSHSSLTSSPPPMPLSIFLIA